MAVRIQGLDVIRPDQFRWRWLINDHTWDYVRANNLHRMYRDGEEVNTAFVQVRSVDEAVVFAAGFERGQV